MSITNTPGTYPVTIIAAELGELGPGKDALKLTYQAGDGGTITQMLCLFGGAEEISLRTLRDAVGYKFDAPLETLHGKACEVVTDNKWSDKHGKEFYQVLYLNAAGGKALAPASPNLMARLAAKAKSLPAQAPRPPRADGPPARPNYGTPRTPAPRPAPRNDFADDENGPF